MLRLAAKQDYDAFYELELQMRQLRSCPPFSDLFTITVAGLEERGLIEASVRLRDALAANLQKEPYCRAPAQLLGQRRPRQLFLPLSADAGLQKFRGYPPLTLLCPCRVLQGPQEQGHYGPNRRKFLPIKYAAVWLFRPNSCNL